jgi:hypothetical protein
MNSSSRLGWVVAFGIYATFALDCYSTFCSSPQTTELNAQARADTLMKWVRIGGLVAIVGGAGATLYSKSAAPLVGAGAITLLMYGMYVHAKNSGLENGGATTEDYSFASSSSSSGW